MKRVQYLLFYSLFFLLYTKNIKGADKLPGGAFTYNAKKNQYVPLSNRRGEKANYTKFIQKESSAVIIKYKNNPIPDVEPQAFHAHYKNKKSDAGGPSQGAKLLPIERQLASMGIEQKLWQCIIKIIHKSLLEKQGSASEENSLINTILTTEYIDWQIINTAYSALHHVEWLRDSTTLRKPYAITSFPYYLMPVIEVSESANCSPVSPESWFLHAIDADIEDSLTQVSTTLTTPYPTPCPGQLYEQEKIEDDQDASDIDWFASLFE